MRYRAFTLLAVLVFAGSLYLFCTKLTELLDTGTCASGNVPYEIARECPEGTDTDAYLIMASVFGLFAAVGLAGLRGPRPGGGGFSFGSMMLTGWALFFTISGGISLYHSLTSDVIGEDGKLGGIIVGATFLFMGVPVLLFVPKLFIDARRTAHGTQSASTVFAGSAPGGEGWLSALRSGSKLMKDMSTQVTTGGSVGSSDSVGSTGSSTWSTEDYPGDGGSGEATISKLERLQKLREAGALTEAEFAAEKARILSSGR